MYFKLNNKLSGNKKYYNNNCNLELHIPDYRAPTSFLIGICYVGKTNYSTKSCFVIKFLLHIFICRFRCRLPKIVKKKESSRFNEHWRKNYFISLYFFFLYNVFFELFLTTWNIMVYFIDFLLKTIIFSMVLSYAFRVVTFQVEELFYLVFFF